jgi:hypothetical protein
MIRHESERQVLNVLEKNTASVFRYTTMNTERVCSLETLIPTYQSPCCDSLKTTVLIGICVKGYDDGL